jgi:hypothetical protein
MTVFFPPFCFAFLLILCFLGLSLNILVLGNFRINWVYIFEIDPKSRLGHQEILKVKFIYLDKFTSSQYMVALTTLDEVKSKFWSL